eukprot:6333621-Alexandrium_andersonii.AAC.1
MANALDEAFTLKIAKGERTAEYTGRAKEIFDRCEREGVVFPAVARGYMTLRGARLPDDRRAIVLANARRSFEEHEIALALRASFPTVVHDGKAHVHLVDPDDQFRPLDLPSPASEGEAEIDALVAEGSEEIMEEEDAVQ